MTTPILPIEHETARLRLVVWQERHVAPFADDLRTLRARVGVALGSPNDAGRSAAVDAWKALRAKVFEPRQPRQQTIERAAPLTFNVGA